MKIIQYIIRWKNDQNKTRKNYLDCNTIERNPQTTVTD